MRNSSFAALTLLLLTISFPLATQADGYWQQEVNYLMDVTLQPDLRTISGSLEIEYVNNSPQTLDVVYLKAFPNAVRKDSPADHKRRTNHDYSLADLGPEQEGSLELFASATKAGERQTYDSFALDGTIIAVYLSEPLQPGFTVVLPFEFRTVLPTPADMRMGFERGVTKAAYWYPQACVYDRKFGWVNSQFLGWGECYGDYGTYEVAITAPADQIVAATGELLNEAEVMPDSMRTLYDIDNYLTPEDQWPVLDVDPSQTKTWRFRAENVNDFALTSSNRFCIDSDSINGVKVVAYPLREKAGRWTRAVELGKQAIATFSELCLDYQWPVIRICDAYCGMEYPMLTNCSGGDPGTNFDKLLYHEIGHQWFMGMIGSSQVDRPFLDEGFATLLEHMAMEKYLGREGNYNKYRNWYQRAFAPPVEVRNARGFRPLLLMMNEGMDKPMAVPFDKGEEYYPYRVSMYYKAAALQYSLRSILGDSLYFDALRFYCEQWLFAHPYEEDFTKSLEEFTGLDFEAYLQQWYYHRYKLDYSFEGRKTREKGHSLEHTIKLRNRAEMVAPVDVAVIWEQGDTTFYTVAPEGMSFAKPGYVLLPAWHQFRSSLSKYEFKITAERRISGVVVDPRKLLPDMDRRNNQSGFLWPTEVRLDNLLYDRTPVDRYALRLRPDLWFDNANGFQTGFHAHGSYLETKAKFSLDVRLGARSARPTVDLTMESPFEPFGSHSVMSRRILRADRRTLISMGYRKEFRKWYSRPDHQLFDVRFDILSISGSQDNRLDPFPEDVAEYLPDPTWDAADVTFLEVTDGSLSSFRYGTYRFLNREGIGGYTEDDQHRAFLKTEFEIGLDLINSSRTWLSLTLQYLGTDGEPPSEYVDHISRARSVERFSHTQMFRSPGTFPQKWEDDFYLANGRVRGYQDRTFYLTDYLGASLELTPPDFLPFRWLQPIPMVGGWLAKTDQALFADVAQISFDDKESFYREPIASNETALSGEDDLFVMSAGLCLKFPSVWKGQSVRLDFPLYLNEPPPGEEEFDLRFSFAWLLPFDLR
ncbi:MAG: M1 family metallopeptidase [bacterium]|nr:M1 family metallopeptidase [bacterium]